MIRSLIGQESTRNTLHQSDTKLPPIATFPLLSRFEFSLALCDIFLFSDWPLEDNQSKIIPSTRAQCALSIKRIYIYIYIYKKNRLSHLSHNLIFITQVSPKFHRKISSLRGKKIITLTYSERYNTHEQMKLQSLQVLLGKVLTHYIELHITFSPLELNSNSPLLFLKISVLRTYS